MKIIPLIKPYITQEIKDKVCEVLDSGFLTEGTVTRQLEQTFIDYIGCKYAIAATSCTTGLEMALRAMGIGSGDEVIVPDYTYPATASVVEIIGAKIVIVDVNPETMLIDYDEIEKAVTPATKAIIPVSIFGNPLDYACLNRIKDKYNLFIIEDAACSIGAEYNGTSVGNLADISVFSLHPRKFITTGEGGMITTNNSSWTKWMTSYKNFGMEINKSWGEVQFERIGTNYKLSNIQAAVGLTQMQEIKRLLSRRTQLAENYINLVSNQPGITLPQTAQNSRHSFQSFCIFVKDRDEVIRKLTEKKIETQIGTYALHMHNAYKNNPNCRICGEMKNSRYAFEHCLTLPLYHDMTEDEQKYVIVQLVTAQKKID